MRMRLRQVALVAADLDAAEAAIESELGVELCYRDPGVAAFGLRNALYPIGHKLLEVVSPTEAGTTAGRLLDKRGGDSGYMVIFEIDDLEGMRDRLASAEARVVFEARAEGVTGLHIHPRDIGGAIVSVDATDQWGDWPWAGPDWRDHVRTDRVADIVAVDIEAVDPEAMAARWAAVLGRTAAGTQVRFDEGVVRFVPASDRGEGVCALEFQSPTGDASETEICGCVVRIRA